MIYVDTQSIQQRNVEAWLMLTATLDERRMRYATSTDRQGTLWIECLGFKAHPTCTPKIQIGPDAGVALLQVWAKQWVPESHYADVRKVLAQVSAQYTRETIKYRAASGEVLIETPISFIDSQLRPKAALYILRRMSHQLDVVMEELWDGLLAGNG